MKKVKSVARYDVLIALPPKGELQFAPTID